MIRIILMASASCVALSGCARVAESRFNPLNWFGQSTSTPATQTEAAPAPVVPLVPANAQVQIVDTRPLVETIVSLRVDRSPNGAIVQATGRTATQGFYNAELVSRGVEGGVLTLEFRAQGPAGFEPVGTARSRTLAAAYVIDATALASIRTVRVQGATNARTSRR